MTPIRPADDFPDRVAEAVKMRLFRQAMVRSLDLINTAATLRMMADNMDRGAKELDSAARAMMDL